MFREPAIDEYRVVKSIAQEILNKSPNQDDYHLLGHLHFFGDIIPFIDTIKKEFRLHPDKIHLTSPEYTWDPDVKESLEDRNYRTYEPDPDSKTAVQKILEVVEDSDSEPDFWYLDDGGVISIQLRRYDGDLHDRCIGGIEQTTNGTRRIEEIEDDEGVFDWPIANTPVTNLKEKAEPLAVAAAIVRALEKYIHWTSGEMLWGKSVGIVGWGNIGEPLADLLSYRASQVYVNDASPGTSLQAEMSAGINNVDAQTVVRESDILINTVPPGEGPSGPPINGFHFGNATDGQIFASVSSKDTAIDKPLLESWAENIEEDDDGIYTLYHMPSARDNISIYLLAGGEPINLRSANTHFPSEFSLPYPVVDLTYATMLDGYRAIVDGSADPNLGLQPLADEDKIGQLWLNEYE